MVYSLNLQKGMEDKYVFIDLFLH